MLIDANAQCKHLLTLELLIRPDLRSYTGCGPVFNKLFIPLLKTSATVTIFNGI